MLKPAKHNQPEDSTENDNIKVTQRIGMNQNEWAKPDNKKPTTEVEKKEVKELPEDTTKLQQIKQQLNKIKSRNNQSPRLFKGNVVQLFSKFQQMEFEEVENEDKDETNNSIDQNSKNNGLNK